MERFCRRTRRCRAVTSRIERSSSVNKIHIAQYLDLDLESERWHCHSCGQVLGNARENYKRGLLVYDRDPSQVHRPIIEGEFTFSPNPEWIRILEFYCP